MQFFHTCPALPCVLYIQHLTYCVSSDLFYILLGQWLSYVCPPPSPPKLLPLEIKQPVPQKIKDCKTYLVAGSPLSFKREGKRQCAIKSKVWEEWCSTNWPRTLKTIFPPHPNLFYVQRFPTCRTHFLLRRDFLAHGFCWPMFSRKMVICHQENTMYTFSGLGLLGCSKGHTCQC